MALPNSIDPSTPAGTDQKKFGDDQIRDLKQFIVDVFGVPGATPITAAPFGISAAGAITALGNITAPIRVNSAADAFVTLGLVLNQGANDDLIAALKSSDVSHPMTDIASAGTFGAFSKEGATQGGLRVSGISDASGVSPLVLEGLAASPNSSKTTAATPAVLLSGRKSNGATGAQALASTENLWGVKNGPSGVVILGDASGNLRLRPGVAGVAPDALMDDLIIEGLAAQAGVGLSFLSPNAMQTGYIAFGDINNSSIGGIQYAHSNDTLALVANTSNVVLGPSAFDVVVGGFQAGRFTADQLFVGNVITDAYAQAGVIIHQGSQGSFDSPGITVRSALDSHGMTALAESTAYFTVALDTNMDGGALIRGYGSDDVGATLQGFSSNGDATKNTSSLAPIVFEAFKAAGTNAQSMGSNENIAVFRNGNTTRAIIDEDGDLLLDGAVTAPAFDDYCDIQVLTAVRATMLQDSDFKARYAEWIEAYAPALAAAGIVSYNDDGRHFVSLKGLNGLIIDTIRQLSMRVDELESKRLWAVRLKSPVRRLRKRLGDALRIWK